MEKILAYLEKELGRAISIYEPLEARLDDEEQESSVLDSDELSNMDYYMGYADGIAAGISVLRLVKEGKEAILE
jgi:hypothetical protein